MKQHILIIMILLAACTAMAQSHVSDLVVTPAFSGGTIIWYDAATGGNVVLGSATLENRTYYASQTINGVESTARLAVTATANPQPQGSLTANGPFCTDGTGQLTWTATAGTGPYTVKYTDGYGDRTATNVVSGTPFNVVRAISVAEGPQYYTLQSVQDANCTRTSGFTAGSATILAGFKPTLTGATQVGTVCDDGAATITLTGLLENKTYTVAYTINGVTQTPVTGVSSTEYGTTASFNTAALVTANNGQTLQITGLTITTPATGCTTAFTQDVTMSVNARAAAPVVSSPILVGATSVSGTSTEADGTRIQIFVDGSSVGEVTVASHSWTITGLTALTAGQIVKAYALATCTSVVSNSVTVRSLAVGDAYGGGKVAYIFSSSDVGLYVEGQTHGLIAAVADQGQSIIWARSDYQGTLVPGGTGSALGTGLTNTDNIVNQHVAGTSTYAAGLARACSDGGYTDWYLPSKDEILKLCTNKVAIGSFAEGDYWSSTESGATTATFIDFRNAQVYPGCNKYITNRVRAVRTF